MAGYKGLTLDEIRRKNSQFPDRGEMWDKIGLNEYSGTKHYNSEEEQIEVVPQETGSA